MGRIWVGKFRSRSAALVCGAMKRMSHASRRAVVDETVRNRMDSLLQSLDQGLARVLGVIGPVLQIEHAVPSVDGLFPERGIILYIRFDLTGNAVNGCVVVVFLDERPEQADELFVGGGSSGEVGSLGSNRSTG